jgi:hypothetical protein
VTKSGMGGGLQQVDVPKQDKDGNVLETWSKIKKEMKSERCY